MKKGFLYTTTSLVAVLLITNSEFKTHTLGLLMAGVVPGTQITLPFWVMMTFYCLAITAIVTLYVEKTFLPTKHGSHSDSTPKRLPKRRYTII